MNGMGLAWTTGMDDEISIMEYRTIMKYHRGGVTTGMDVEISILDYNGLS